MFNFLLQAGLAIAQGGMPCGTEQAAAAAAAAAGIALHHHSRTGCMGCAAVSVHDVWFVFVPELPFLQHGSIAFVIKWLRHDRGVITHSEQVND